MTQSQKVFHLGFQPRRRGAGLMAPIMWLGGLIAACVAMAAGAVLAVITAAAVAVIAVTAGVVVFFAGLAVRARRRMAPAPAAEGVIDARKVGDTWVTYGWERESR